MLIEVVQIALRAIPTNGEIRTETRTAAELKLELGQCQITFIKKTWNDENWAKDTFSGKI